MMKIIPLKLLILTVIFSCSSFAQNSSYKIGLLKYNGGGDWYANPTALSNLILYSENCNKSKNFNLRGFSIHDAKYIKDFLNFKTQLPRITHTA